MEARNYKSAVTPIHQSISPGYSTIGADAVGFRHWTCVCATACKAGRQSGKREAGWPGVRFAWPARGARYQIFGLAQVLLQGSWNEDGVTSISGTFETGQSAVRIDLTEREGDKAARP